MEGLEILSQTAICESPYTFKVFIISIIICGIFAFIAGCIKKDIILGILDAIIGMFLGIFVGLIIATIVKDFTKQPTGEYTYKVTVDDTVKFNEFYDKYEIISQDGKIFEVKLRENYNG